MHYNNIIKQGNLNFWKKTKKNSSVLQSKVPNAAARIRALSTRSTSPASPASPASSSAGSSSTSRDRGISSSSSSSRPGSTRKREGTETIDENDDDDYLADRDEKPKGRRSPSKSLRPLARSVSINSGSYMINGEEQEMHDPKFENMKQAAGTRVTKSLVGANVHGSYNAKIDRDRWLKQPLFRRGGVATNFSSGEEAAELLIGEAKRRDPYQFDFIESLTELTHYGASLFEAQPPYAWILKQMMEPERLLTFRVSWKDDQGNSRINRGYRVQYSSSLGPFRGGLRFHPGLQHGSTRMLGFEQMLKNSLSGYPFGGARGGSDFDPTDKSESEIRRFCQSFMMELAPFIGPQLDTLEGGLGVGPRELEFLLAQYNDTVEEMGIVNSASAEELFGSAIMFPGATGYGVAYFAERTLEQWFGTTLEGKRCMISGSGNQALHTAKKLAELGAVPVSISDSTGFLYEKDGFDSASLDDVRHIKAHRGDLADYVHASSSAKFFDIQEGSMWEQVQGDLAFPSIMHGEINADEASALAESGCVAVFEGADRACSVNASKVFKEKNVLVAPSKACSIGSAVASGCLVNDEEGNSNPNRLDMLLRRRMHQVYDEISEAAIQSKHPGDLRAGANVLSFLRIANSPAFSGKPAQQ